MSRDDREAYVLSGIRTPIGAYGGALKDVPTTALAAECAREAMRRAAVEPGEIGHVVFGNVIHTEPRDMYLARVAAIEAGVPDAVPALTLNRLCGSGLQAVVSATQSIMLGDHEVALAGGAESMSRSLHAVGDLRWGRRLGDAPLIDMMVGALTDPFGNGHMGNTAENVARRRDVGRAEQDRFAAESHRRAAEAIAEGRFAGQILKMEVRAGRETRLFETDENVRADATEERLGKLRPAFDEAGTVTAGNSSTLNDGAAALVLASGREVRRRGARPMARILGYAHAGVSPSEMGLGPVPAVRRLLAKTGLEAGRFDLVESNEAFAAQACAVARELGFDPARTNPNGGAIALGHPIGATGAMLLVKTVHELARTGGRLGLVTMCIGGGQGIALAVEAMA